MGRLYRNLHAALAVFAVCAGVMEAKAQEPAPRCAAPSAAPKAPQWGGADPNMFRGAQAAPSFGLGDDARFPGPKITAPVGADGRKLENLIANAPKGATVFLPAGEYQLRQTLRIFRGDVRLQGAGVGRTVLKAAFPQPHSGNWIEVRSSRGDALAVAKPAIDAPQTTLSKAAPAQSQELWLEDDLNLQPADLLEISFHKPPREPNSFDRYRRVMVEVRDVEGAQVMLKAPLGLSAPQGAAVAMRPLLRNLAIQDLTLAGARPSIFPRVYENADEPRPVWGRNAAFHISGVRDSAFERLSVTDAHSKAFVFADAYKIRAHDLLAKGARNRGVGGNGYGVELLAVYYSDFTALDLRETRHSVSFNMIGSSAFNAVHLAFADQNADFHGGPDFSNVIYIEALRQAVGQPGWPAFEYRDPATEAANHVIFAALSSENWAPDVARAAPSGGVLLAGPREDKLISGPGDDLLSGGKDADIFIFEAPIGNDVILDFTPKQDALQFRAPLSLEAAQITQTPQGALLDFGADGTLLLCGAAP